MELYPFQHEGTVFLSTRSHAMNGDEMGLGKTVQGIRAADMVGAMKLGIISPASVRSVWEEEIDRWSLLSPDRMIFSYSEIVTNPDKRVTLLDFAPDVLILDEAHYLKSPDAKRTRLIYGQIAKHVPIVWALSGTPAPNNPTEMWTHFRVLGGEDLSYTAFADRYCYLGPSDYSDFRVFGNRPEMVPEFRSKLRPWFLRRRLKDVGFQLPPIRWGSLPLTVPQATRDLKELDAEVRASLPPEGDTEDFLAALERESRYLATLLRLTGLAKVPATVRYVREELEENGVGKIILFAHHKEVVHEALKLIPSAHQPVVITGETSERDRIAARRAFQDGSSRVLLGNITAAGTGLTLTASHRAIFMESSWSPADMAQAAKRIHRIGQDKPCLVQVTSLSGSVDEIVSRVRMRKARSIADMFKEDPHEV